MCQGADSGSFKRLDQEDQGVFWFRGWNCIFFLERLQERWILGWWGLDRVLLPGLRLPNRVLSYATPLVGEGNGTPLQYSCLENPRDGGAAVYGVAQSRTQLKQCSSSSSSFSKSVTTNSKLPEKALTLNFCRGGFPL